MARYDPENQSSAQATAAPAPVPKARQVHNPTWPPKTGRKPSIIRPTIHFQFPPFGLLATYTPIPGRQVRHGSYAVASHAIVRSAEQLHREPIVRGGRSLQDDRGTTVLVNEQLEEIATRHGQNSGR